MDANKEKDTLKYPAANSPCKRPLVEPIEKMDHYKESRVTITAYVNEFSFVILSKVPLLKCSCFKYIGTRFTQRDCMVFVMSENDIKQLIG